MIALIVLLFIVVTASLVLAQYQAKVIHEQRVEIIAQGDEVTRLLNRNAELRERKRLDDSAAEAMLIALVPLIEKSDWTTGNYIGRLGYLRAQEARRNDLVDEIRTALLRLPAIVDYIRAHGMDLFKGAATEGLNRIVR